MISPSTMVILAIMALVLYLDNFTDVSGTYIWALIGVQVTIFVGSIIYQRENRCRR